MTHFKRRASALVAAAVLASATLIGASGCKTDPAVTEQHALEHVGFLSQAVETDVQEVRGALPQGAPLLTALWKDGQDPAKDPEAAKDALNRTRNKVQDLRLVKSTFFALASADGTIIRNDLEQDMMAGQNLFESYPGLRAAAGGKYTEAVGSMHEARGVEGKPDGQWVAAQPVEVDGKVSGLYVTGWTWAQYAYRLETALKSHLQDLDANEKPLFYVFVVVGKQAYGTRISPVVNAEAIVAADPLSKLDAGGSFKTTVEITDRSFGLAVKAVPALGDQVAIAVLRSET